MNQSKFNHIINQFKTSKDQAGNHLNMHYLFVQQGTETYTYHFNHREEPSDIRSISKTVLTMVAGIVMDLSAQGKLPDFNEDTYIYPIIKDVVNLTNLANEDRLKKVTVKHLLTHRIGFDQVLLMRGDIADVDPFTYLDYVINTPINHEPGEYYLYSNAGFYLLSVVLEEFLKEDLLGFIDHHLFDPLDIRYYSWDKYGHYLAGATRLKMYPDDLLKLGQVLMNQGRYKDVSIISKQQIHNMLVPTTYTPHLDNPDAIFSRHAYASGIWLGKEPIFFGHGTDGQILAMIPEKDTIIVTLANQHDIRPIEAIVDQIIRELD